MTEIKMSAPQKPPALGEWLIETNAFGPLIYELTDRGLHRWHAQISSSAGPDRPSAEEINKIALLMRAAPDLLAAAIAIVGAVGHFDSQREAAAIRHAVELAKAAIAKARGEDAFNPTIRQIEVTIMTRRATDFTERTDEEILARIAEVKSADFFGTIQTDLILRLPFDAAKPFLKEGTRPEDFISIPRDRASILGEIAEYMPFAWHKANNCRGLSAARSLDHMKAWLWLLGEDAAVEALMKGYSHYGKPQLRAICEATGVDWRALDDGRWTNREDDDGVSASDVDDVTLPFIRSLRTDQSKRSEKE